MNDYNNNPANSIYEENFKVRSYEIDSQGRVSIQSICRYLGEIAGNHANKLGASVAALRRKRLTWVLSRLHVRMQKYPFSGEAIKIKTWPSGRKNLFALRDFNIFLSSGKLIGKAITSWMVIDLTRKKPVSLPDFIIRIPIPQRPRAIEDSFEKLPALEKVDFSKSFNIRLSDLDTNQHVNFVNYIEWAVEAIPAETWKEFKLEDLEISYREEIRYGERIISEVQRFEQKDRQIYYHRLCKERDHTEAAVLKTIWIHL